ncbi:Replication termination factor 2 [Daldinia childiae]|uniref:Replication termination factor 2 n=1 Tax=Daldinia childiae TaxID=326645 RepID=UPI00144526E9|nr:Replication termination factor 2 [Daldinia childiae]KAF3063492.1 Replication termination factor 2 [Daldinia childiae]
MGNDGGSIPKRRELVREAARLPTASELKATALESLTHAWTMCPLSDAPLDFSNTVSDWRGRLYNYESVLQCLMPSSSETPVSETQESEFSRTGIKSLKDVLKLKITTKKDEKGREFAACPVSMKELGAATKSVYIVPCGHVFAEVTMKEISDTEKQCPECSSSFEKRDVIPILPTDEAEVEKLAKRVDDLRVLGLTHSLKKDKSTGKKKRKADETKENKSSNEQKEKDLCKTDKSKEDKNGIASRINNPMTASLTAKVLAEQEERAKRRKIADGYKRSEAVR